VQSQIESGDLGFKAEKELIKQIKELHADKERLKDYQAQILKGQRYRQFVK
jgi:hypothetical protein